MKPVLMLSWRLLQWPGLVFVVNIAGQVLISGTEGQRAVGKAFAWTLATAIFVGTRAVAFTKLRTLHVLPHGHRTLMRALALLAGGCTLVAGIALIWVYGALFAAPSILVFVIMTALALWVFMARMSRPWRLLLPVVLVPLAFALTIVVRSSLSDAGMWVPVLAALAVALAAWSYMLRAERLPMSGETRAPDGDARAFTTPAWLLRSPRSSATLTLLQSGRTAVNRLPLALTIVLGAAIFFHLLLGKREPVDNYPVMIALVLQFVSVLAFSYSFTLAGNARLLWLRSGASRAKLFGIAERSLAQYGLVVLAGWATVTGLALSRGLRIDAGSGLLMLVPMAASALWPLYIGLMFKALRTWQRVIAGAVLLFTWLVVPLLWVRSFGMTPQGTGSPRVSTLVTLLVITLLLRFAARRAWGRIDWARLRPNRAVLS